MRWMLSAVVLLPATVFAQEPCEDNTVRYGQHRETAASAIALSPGAGIGQFYERPGPMDLVGMEIYAYGYDQTTCNTVGACVEQGNLSAFDLRAEVYLADANGLPTGSSVVSRDITLTCRCDPTDLNNIRERFAFDPIELTGDFVVTVTNTDSNDTLVVRTNSFSNGDGEQEDLGRHFVYPGGGQSRQWFPASVITVGSGGTQADADVYAHPIIDFDLDATFEVEGPRSDACVEAGEELSFFATDPIASSPIYNTDVRDGASSSAWQFGDGTFGNGASVSHTYDTSTTRTVRHTQSFVGDTAICSTLTNRPIEAVVPYFFDCDQDGFSSSVGDTYCGAPTVQGGECSGVQVPLFELQDDGDCNDSNASTYPGAPESCDNVDNDCNGSIDDDVEDRPVTAPFGECSTDVEFCELGNWFVDPNNVGPTAEVCDGLDQDCNDVVDNGVSDELSDNQTGACAGNVDVCQDGDFEASAANHVPSADICDGIDNDCDAQTADGADDPQLGEPCDGDDADDCESGELVCSAGGLVCSDGPELDDCSDPDTDTDPDPDTDPDSDTDTDTDTDSDVTPPTTGTRCGCASGPSGMSLFGFGLLLLGFVSRRR